MPATQMLDWWVVRIGNGFYRADDSDPVAIEAASFYDSETEADREAAHVRDVWFLAPGTRVAVAKVNLPVF